MSAPTIARPLEDLMPAARDLAEAVGGIPSRNKLMTSLRVGAPKASALREALAAEAAEVEPVPDPWDFAEPASALAPISPAPELPAVYTPVPVAYPPAPVVEASAQVSDDRDPGIRPASRRTRKVSTWPVMLIALPAFVAIWSGWVGLGGLTGFGVVHPLPGIADGFSLNTAITLPIGVEIYAAYALRIWLSGAVPPRAGRFAKLSAIGSLLVGALGQVAYHILTAAGITGAPWWITTLVACLPVAVLGMGAALAHLIREDGDQ
ncbi:ABC transporter permease [Dactylosporangium sp. McL0621]|uniref:ABC transporter permease n=1 Tax=Dactylosporangium sp. McL0621 TaxID=3415678 RepID=UPI003CFB3C5E